MSALLRTTRRIALLAAGLSLLAACGGSSTPAAAPPGGSSPTAAAHNTADVTFATDMIPHHGQAVEMAELALTQATDAEVKKLATAIKGAQAPEIATMTGWLTQWGAPVPGSGSGHHMGGMAMTGMMSDDEMASLGAARGTAFDSMWLDMMTRHHQGAIQMSKTEIAAGQDPQAVALARQIITAQTAEIATMATLRARLG